MSSYKGSLHSTCLECDVCKEKFLMTSKYLDHMSNQSCIKISCNICNKSFQNQEDLDKHYLTHQDVISTYNCTKCGKKFLHRYQLETHMDSHGHSSNADSGNNSEESLNEEDVPFVDHESDEDYVPEEKYASKSSRQWKKPNVSTRRRRGRRPKSSTASNDSLRNESGSNSEADSEDNFATNQSSSNHASSHKRKMGFGKNIGKRGRPRKNGTVPKSASNDSLRNESGSNSESDSEDNFVTNQSSSNHASSHKRKMGFGKNIGKGGRPRKNSTVPKSASNDSLRNESGSSGESDSEDDFVTNQSSSSHTSSRKRKMGFRKNIGKRGRPRKNSTIPKSASMNISNGNASNSSSDSDDNFIDETSLGHELTSESANQTLDGPQTTVDIESQNVVQISKPLHTERVKENIKIPEILLLKNAYKSVSTKEEKKVLDVFSIKLLPRTCNFKKKIELSEAVKFVNLREKVMAKREMEKIEIEKKKLEEEKRRFEEGKKASEEERIKKIKAQLEDMKIGFSTSSEKNQKMPAKENRSLLIPTPLRNISSSKEKNNIASSESSSSDSSPIVLPKPKNPIYNLPVATSNISILLPNPQNPIQNLPLAASNVISKATPTVNTLASSVPPANEEGILEKTLVNNILYVKVTPEYMQKMQRNSASPSVSKSAFQTVPDSSKSIISNSTSDILKSSNANVSGVKNITNSSGNTNLNSVDNINPSKSVTTENSSENKSMENSENENISKSPENICIGNSSENETVENSESSVISKSSQNICIRNSAESVTTADFEGNISNSLKNKPISNSSESIIGQSSKNTVLPNSSEKSTTADFEGNISNSLKNKPISNSSESIIGESSKKTVLPNSSNNSINLSSSEVTAIPISTKKKIPSPYVYNTGENIRVNTISQITYGNKNVRGSKNTNIQCVSIDKNAQITSLNKNIQNTPLVNKNIQNIPLVNKNIQNTPLVNKNIQNTPLVNKNIQNTPLMNKVALSSPVLKNINILSSNKDVQNISADKIIQNASLSYISAAKDFQNIVNSPMFQPTVKLPNIGVSTNLSSGTVYLMNKDSVSTSKLSDDFSVMKSPHLSTSPNMLRFPSLTNNSNIQRDHIGFNKCAQQIMTCPVSQNQTRSLKIPQGINKRQITVVPSIYNNSTNIPNISNTHATVHGTDKLYKVINISDPHGLCNIQTPSGVVNTNIGISPVVFTKKSDSSSKKENRFQLFYYNFLSKSDKITPKEKKIFDLLIAKLQEKERKKQEKFERKKQMKLMEKLLKMQSEQFKRSKSKKTVKKKNRIGRTDKTEEKIEKTFKANSKEKSVKSECSNSKITEKKKSKSTSDEFSKVVCGSKRTSKEAELEENSQKKFHNNISSPNLDKKKSILHQSNSLHVNEKIKRITKLILSLKNDEKFSLKALAEISEIISTQEIAKKSLFILKRLRFWLRKSNSKRIKNSINLLLTKITELNRKHVRFH